jgi:predicted ABC-type ATPase
VNRSSAKKLIQIVAGPNGGGKTTFANAYLLENRSKSVYLNPDRIAAGISPFEFEKASFQAGRVLIGEIKSRLNLGENFAFESTLSGRTYYSFLKDAIHQGYEVHIYFLYLKSIEKNLQRIKKRVSLGGHPIPKEAVLRRQKRCFDNFWNLYRPLCTAWYVFDNSGKKPQLVQSRASFEKLLEKHRSLFISHFLQGKML